MANKKVNIVFHIDGGFGKCVMGSAVAKCIKNNYPNSNLIVVASWPEALLNLPFIDRVYKQGVVPYFYDDYIKDKNVKIFKLDPYNHESFLLQKQHLIVTWCELFGLKYNNEEPEFLLNQSEIDRAITLFKIDRNKPLFVIQTNGGMDNQENIVSWARDIPIPVAQLVVNNIQSKFNNSAQIYHIRRQNQPELQNVTAVTGAMRYLSALVALSNKRLLIDSFTQHVAAAFKLPSTVCWIGNSPQVFGYNVHTNIIPAVEKDFTHKVDSYLDLYEWTGSRTYECPYKDINRIFDVDLITKTLLDN